MRINTKYAYLAGLIDGEGYLGVYGLGVKLVVSNSDLKIIKWIYDNIGGYVNIRQNPSPTSFGGKIVYNWLLTDRPSLSFLLPKLIPYLTAKKEKAISLLNWIKNRPKIQKRPLTRGVIIK